jgi:hypothetical protein
MGLPRRIVRWLYSQPEDEPRRPDPADRGSLLSLTVMLGRRKVQLEIGSSADSEDPGFTPAAEGVIPQPRGEAGSAPHLPPPGRADISFWDALDPIEREALRAVASWRTFAAGALIMQEGERADHVIVILGGRARICVNENGRERLLGERGLGQLVGERGALQVSVRSATVIALEMVWALVVETKDFAAFITAHPRVLALVQSQHYDRRTGEPAEYGHDNAGPANFRAGPPSRMAATGQPNGFTPGHEPSLDGQNCTVTLTDVVGFGASNRTDRDRLIIRKALFQMTHAAMRCISGVWSEDRGDGILMVAPPNVSTAKVLDRLLQELPRALDQHNCSERESARFQLRLAVNVGPVVSDTMGVSGEAIIVAARLVEAPDFKQALVRSTAELGVIASPFVYETVIRHGQDPDYVATYSPVPVEVKESRTTAWMTLFAAPPPSLAVTEATGSESCPSP